MRIKLVVAAAILLSGTACSSAPAQERLIEEKASDRSALANNEGVVQASIVQAADKADNEGDVPLSWENYSNRGSVQLLKGGLKQAERIVKETSLYAVDGSQEPKVVIYARKNDTDHLYAALIKGEAAYDLGAIAGYSYDQDNQLTVRNLWLFGKEAFKIQGFVGAAASISRYFELVDGVPKPLLVVDEGHALEMDVDHDGQLEVVSAAGTSPRMAVYRWNGGRIERSSLNDALQTDAVSFTDEGAILAAYGQDDRSPYKLYWLQRNGLKHFQTYSREEYESERFVAIPYTIEEVLRIRELADGLRVFEPFVPHKGIATDYGVEAERERDGVLKLSYPHFSIRQSKTDLRPKDSGGVPPEKRYFPEYTAEWIGLPDSEAGGSWYLQRDSTYLSISTAKPYSKEQLLFVAASLRPLEELTLSDGSSPAVVTPPQITREYLFALKAVNEFASAWARRDPEAGLKWVSEDWKAGKDPEQLDAFFRGTSNPHHMTFELSGKRRVDDHTYLFALRLYEYYSGQPDSILGFPADYGRGWTIEAVREGENEAGEGVWRVRP